MTDAQLSVLLYQYSTRLTTMIEAAEAALPDEAKQEQSWINFANPPDFKTVVLRTPALDDLRAFAQELKQDSELLELTAKGEKKKQP
jgi:hypothetical protein